MLSTQCNHCVIAGALGEEVLMELLDLIAAGETRPEDIRPKK